MVSTLDPNNSVVKSLWCTHTEICGEEQLWSIYNRNIEICHLNFIIKILYYLKWLYSLFASLSLGYMQLLTKWEVLPFPEEDSTFHQCQPTFCTKPYGELIRGVFEKNCLLCCCLISTCNWKQIITYLYSTIQYLHNDVYMCP